MHTTAIPKERTPHELPMPQSAPLTAEEFAEAETALGRLMTLALLAERLQRIAGASV